MNLKILNYFSMALVLLGPHINAQTQMDYIFDKASLAQKSEDMKAIQSVMARYYEGVERAKGDLLEEVFHSAWYMRDNDSEDRIQHHGQNKRDFIDMVVKHGLYKGYAHARKIADLSFIYEHLAFVRVNKDPSRSSTSFFLYKIEGRWWLMDKLWVYPREVAEGLPTHQSSYQEVEKLIRQYYEAVSANDQNKLEKVLHESWDLKYLENRALSIMKRKEFLKTLDDSGGKTIDYSQLMSIDLYHDQLAIARLDLPQSGMTACLIMFKAENGWQIMAERR